jgi:hypothetical protein
MGLGTLRLHRALTEPAVGAVPAKTREEILEQQLADERARSEALLAETIALRAAAKAMAPVVTVSDATMAVVPATPALAKTQPQQPRRSR